MKRVFKTCRGCNATNDGSPVTRIAAGPLPYSVFLHCLYCEQGVHVDRLLTDIVIHVNSTPVTTFQGRRITRVIFLPLPRGQNSIPRQRNHTA